MNRPPRTPPLVFVLALIVALAVCAIGAAVMVPALLGVGAWLVLVVGVLALLAALAGLWAIQRRRDRTLW